VVVDGVAPEDMDGAGKDKDEDAKLLLLFPCKNSILSRCQISTIKNRFCFIILKSSQVY
jgi:hypothetical protein